MLNGKSLLVTGGTGSFGKTFVKTVLERYPNISRLVIYSRDELKQFDMSQTFNKKDFDCIRYFIGDVRDRDRLIRAFDGIDIVVHAAALKQVPAAEYNPMECIKTNVLGAENVIEAALETGVKKVVALSTDKAAAPVNLYGATKLCSDKLFVAANNMKGDRDLSFSVVRYGNVMGSRGSVIPFFIKKREEGILPVTHENMTRFTITLQDGVEFVLTALDRALGGEIFVPKIPSYRINDIAKAISPSSEIKYVGIRPGEKIHEEMITADDSLNTIEFRDYYVIAPSTSVWDPEDLIKKWDGRWVEHGFQYNSGKNDQWLDVPTIQKLIKSEVDSTFEPK